MAFILNLRVQLICAFVFANVKSRVSHDTAHTESGVEDLSALWPTRPQDGLPSLAVFLPQVTRYNHFCLLNFALISPMGRIIHPPT